MRVLKSALEAGKALFLAGFYLLKEWAWDGPRGIDCISETDPEAAFDTAYALCHAVGADQIAEEYGLASADRHRVAEHFSNLYQEPVRKHVVDGALQGFLDFDKEQV